MKPRQAAQDLRVRPQLLVGAVLHKRLRPARNAFRYGVYALRLPLRAIAQAPWGNRWCSHNRFNLLSFHDTDHGDGSTPPLQWIERLLHAEGIDDATGEIWLQTFPRVFGYVFNPVSFWFCQRADGALRAVLCEVNNTFGERHCYLLDTGAPIIDGTPLAARKVFHVSPFCEVAGDYTFRFINMLGQPPRCVARIDYADAAGPLLLTSIGGVVQPLDARHTIAAFLRYPMMTFGVVARIHWQALKLWTQRVGFRPKPPPPASAVTRARTEPTR